MLVTKKASLGDEKPSISPRGLFADKRYQTYDAKTTEKNNLYRPILPDPNMFAGNPEAWCISHRAAS